MALLKQGKNAMTGIYLVMMPVLIFVRTLSVAMVLVIPVLNNVMTAISTVVTAVQAAA